MDEGNKQMVERKKRRGVADKEGTGEEFREKRIREDNNIGK